MLWPLLILAAADPVPPTPPAETSVQAAVAVVHCYYRAIDRHDHVAAHRIWSGGRSLAAMRRGYAHTRSVHVTALPPFETEGAAGSIFAEIRVVVTRAPPPASTSASRAATRSAASTMSRDRARRSGAGISRAATS